MADDRKTCLHIRVAASMVGFLQLIACSVTCAIILGWASRSIVAKTDITTSLRIAAMVGLAASFMAIKTILDVMQRSFINTDYVLSVTNKRVLMAVVAAEVLQVFCFHVVTRPDYEHSHYDRDNSFAGWMFWAMVASYGPIIRVVLAMTVILMLRKRSSGDCDD